MSTETEQALKDWENVNRDTTTDLHEHFIDFGRWDWLEISQEARRVYNLMFDDAVEYDSPISGILEAASAQAAEGAFAAVAACLGVDARALEGVVAPWYEEKDSPPESISTEELMKQIHEYAERLRELEKANALDNRPEGGLPPKGPC